MEHFHHFCQILEAAHRIGATDMKKHALDLVVGHFPKVTAAVRGKRDALVVQLSKSFQQSSFD